MTRGVEIDPQIPGIGILTGLTKAEEGEAIVRKVGQGSGLTVGRVAVTPVDHLIIPYPELGDVGFNGVIEIHGIDGPFSRAGDSGALVVDEEHRGLGLIFAGDEGRNRSLAFDLKAAIGALGLALDIA